MTRRRFIHPLRLALLGGISALAFAATTHYCPAVAEAQTRSGQSSAEEVDYLLTLSTFGTYTAGTQGTVVLTAAPKSPFKIDTTYPIKWVFGDPPGELTYSVKKLEKADGTVTEGAATFKLLFTAKSAGRATISGKLSFKVCAEKCNTHTVDMSLTVDVAAPAPAPAP